MTKIAIFTSNQPRHIAFVRSAAAMFDDIVVFIETTTLFPGEIEDFYSASSTMREYFGRVRKAESNVFGEMVPLPKLTAVFPMRMGDATHLPIAIVESFIEGRKILVFGASYIRPPLIDALVERQAMNIHVGIAPQYRGNSCNFWALNDGRPHLVGSTIHYLSRGLDTGDVLMHALPQPRDYDSFDLGMHAVRAGHMAILDLAARSEMPEAHAQDATKLIRYARKADFSDEVARKFLDRHPSGSEISRAQIAGNISGLVNPGWY